MLRFSRYLSVIIILAMFLFANTIDVAVGPVLSRNTEGIQEFWGNESTVLHNEQAATNFHSKVHDICKGNPERHFENLWGFEPFPKDVLSDDAEECGDWFCVDEDSMDMIIGVNNTNVENYVDLLAEISRSKGEIVNIISAKGKTIAIVVDMPLTVISSFMERVQGSGLVRYLEPNMKVQAQSVPNDQYWSLQWGPKIIEADYAWNTTTGDPSVLVAVVDTGVDYDHPDLAGNYVPHGYDWVNNDADPMDDHGHGTHCAGIIAAVMNNNIGIAGLAQIQVMAEKVLDSGGWGSWDWVANGIINAADSGADIISMSLGGYGESDLVHEAVKYAYDSGVLIIAAAGNEGWDEKLYPAAYKEVVAVTATNQYDNPAGFTNFGEWVEVAAPGVGIYSTIWDNSYDYKSGTSMACPHVAGAAALIWSQFPNVTRDWVRAQLRYTAEDLGKSGFDDYYGHGRINARNAVEQTPPDHDLIAFDFDTPEYIQPRDLVSLDVTVLNFGANNEINATVQLLVDGNLTDSTLINYLEKGTSTTVSLSWSPSMERTYNVTLYVVPVPGETANENNMIMEMISVRTVVGFVLFDQTRCEPIIYYDKWVTNLTNRAYVIDSYTAGTITFDALVDYDILVIPQAWFDYSPDEISAIQDFVLSGGGLLVIGDNSPSIYTSLTDFSGITWDLGAGWAGYTGNITPHDVTAGVASVYFGAAFSQLLVDSPATDLIRDGGGYNEIMLAVSQTVAGRVICIADEDTVNDYAIDTADNLLLANNMIDWLLGVKYEHELIARLDAPSYVEPNKTLLLNATVSNFGLNNETNVELRLLINGTLVNNMTIPELVNGTSYTMNYSWTTPSFEAIFNITAYTPPVPNENVTQNNRRTKFVKVQYPLINPVEGQYANYIECLYDSAGYLLGTAYLNLTYDYYIEPYKIYVTMWLKDPSGYVSTGWMIVNTMNRYVESGVWGGFWYPGWIETGIDIGSTINLLDGTATVNVSRITIFKARAIDCWEIFFSQYGYPYLFWYDKGSGVWMGMESINPYTQESIELSLIDTNIQLGKQYEHDLGVTLDAPQSIQPGETSLLNATIYNIGLNNETNIEIQLFINGTKVASETLDKLANGTWHTVNYSWTPTTEGIYNLTAYAPPVTGENVTINNIATKIINVRYIQVALISDHFELLSVTPILNSMGIGYDIYNNNDFYRYTEDLLLLLKYKAVIFYTEYPTISKAEYVALESYVSSGGNLLVTGFDCLVTDQLLADLVRSSLTGDNVGQSDLYVVEDTHPIMDGPYGSFPSGHHVSGLFSDCDMAEADTAQNAVTVAELANGYDKVIATEELPGKVVFWNGVGPDDWTWNTDCERMFMNLIHWFIVVYEHELIVSLDCPNFLEPGDSALLNATVANRGLNDEASVELQLLINKTLVKSVVIPDLANGTSYMMNYTWAPTPGSTYNITVYAPPVPGENVTRNNIFSKLVPVEYAPRILAYVQYTDYNEEYKNTLRAIESAFGPNYIVTEMWHFALIQSMISGQDILLIPEQEYEYFSTMVTIGKYWYNLGVLADFLEDGGIIIVCDYNGASYGILTGAGLMSISGKIYKTFSQLYLIDPTDPLAEGVVSTFTGPDGTISFMTSETNVVIDDGTYPVVINKEVDRGHVMLLGFDYYSSNSNTEQLIGNAVALAAYITVSTSPSAGSRGTIASLTGTKATPDGTVEIYWDNMLMGNTIANEVGDFTYSFTVPHNAKGGIHNITAIDTATGRRASTIFSVILVILNPTEGSAGTKVTVNGAGFSPESQVTVTYNDMLIGYATVNDFGNFTFTFNTPLSSPETQMIKAIDTEGNYASAPFAVIDTTPLDIKIDVGEMHFIGEVAEFYAQTVLNGQAVNATITNVTLYRSDGTAVNNLTAQQVTTGLYKIVYTILENNTGTYTLVMTCSYTTDSVRTQGTSFECFLVSDTLTMMNKRIVEIKDGIAIIQTEIGLVRLNLTAMDMTLENIFLKVIAINGTTAVIQTTLGTINGTITDTIAPDIAQIIVPGVGRIETDISHLRETQEAAAIPQYIIMAIALVAAASSAISVIMLRRRKTTKIE